MENLIKSTDDKRLRAIEIKRGEFDWLIGKWAKSIHYEIGKDEIPLWAKGDVWNCRYFICRTSYYIDTNPYDLEPPTITVGKLVASLAVLLGYEAREYQEKHGGILDIARLPRSMGHVNKVFYFDGGIWDVPLYENSMDDAGNNPYMIPVDDQPPWFKFIKGQTTMF